LDLKDWRGRAAISLLAPTGLSKGFVEDGTTEVNALFGEASFSKSTRRTATCLQRVPSSMASCDFRCSQ
jgi:hypothetical protein